ncbi:MAG: PadR family transcriptional regulator [Anaerolineales bacterium]|nr:PadR family transcriptional regulator [Anaerolineales bacterium]
MARKNATTGDIVERMLDEWKGGMLTYWVLGLLTLRPMYGLEIKKEIEQSSEGKIMLGVSTIYQLLRRLEKRSMVTSHWEKSQQGPPRAYYETTPEGRAIVLRFIEEVLSPTSPIPNALGRLTQQIGVRSMERGDRNG